MCVCIAWWNMNFPPRSALCFLCNSFNLLRHHFPTVFKAEIVSCHAYLQKHSDIQKQLTVAHSAAHFDHCFRGIFKIKIIFQQSSLLKFSKVVYWNFSQWFFKIWCVLNVLDFMVRSIFVMCTVTPDFNRMLLWMFRQMAYCSGVTALARGLELGLWRAIL